MKKQKLDEEGSVINNMFERHEVAGYIFELFYSEYKKTEDSVDGVLRLNRNVPTKSSDLDNMIKEAVNGEAILKYLNEDENLPVGVHTWSTKTQPLRVHGVT